MRHLSPQLPLTAPWIAHAHATELAAISALLDEQPALSAGVQQDLEAGCPTNARTGRPGLSGEQTLRLLIVRQLTGWTYAELAFHLADSMTYRAFCRVGDRPDARRPRSRRSRRRCAASRPARSPRSTTDS